MVVRGLLIKKAAATLVSISRRFRCSPRHAQNKQVAFRCGNVDGRAGRGDPRSGCAAGIEPEPLLVRAYGETPVPGKCIFKEDLDLIAARRALKRTTLNNDAEAPFDPDYLVGRWKFDYDLPESAIGAGGQISGTETIQHTNGCLYESTTQAKGPDGAFTIKSTIVYDPSSHYMLVQERDSRGFEVLKYGRVGGDSGGFYTHHWDAIAVHRQRQEGQFEGVYLHGVARELSRAYPDLGGRRPVRQSGHRLDEAARNPRGEVTASQLEQLPTRYLQSLESRHPDNHFGSLTECLRMQILSWREVPFHYAFVGHKLGDICTGRCW